MKIRVWKYHNKYNLCFYGQRKRWMAEVLVYVSTFLRVFLTSHVLQSVSVAIDIHWYGSYLQTINKAGDHSEEEGEEGNTISHPISHFHSETNTSSWTLYRFRPRSWRRCEQCKRWTVMTIECLCLGAGIGSCFKLSSSCAVDTNTA